MKAFFAAVGSVLKNVLQSIHWKQFAVACSAIIILMTSSGASAKQSVAEQAYNGELPPAGDVGRPRTMNQWEAEAEALDGQPGKKLKRIAEESANAVKNMGDIYPQNAKTLVPGVDNGALPTDD